MDKLEDLTYMDGFKELKNIITGEGMDTEKSKMIYDIVIGEFDKNELRGYGLDVV